MRATLTLLTPILLLASCAGPTPTPAPLARLAPPPERAAISEAAGNVTTATTATRREADALRNQVGQLRRTAQEAAGAAQRASTELDRLVEQKSATEQELVNLQLIFSELARRNMFLEEEGHLLEVSHKGLSDAVERLEESVDTLSIESAEKDAEVRDLRERLKAATDYASELHTEYQRVAKAAAKAEVGQAASKTWQTIGLIIIVCVFLLALAWIALSIYKPRISI